MNYTGSKRLQSDSVMNTLISSRKKGRAAMLRSIAKTFQLYTEKIFNESDELPGFVVGGENLNNLRYADDTALLTESESALQNIVDMGRQNSEEKGLSMNVKKTKRMVCRDKTPNVRIVVNGKSYK